VTRKRTRKRTRPGARRRGYDAEWQAERAKVVKAWVRAGLPCALCGRPLEKGQRVDVDHIETLADAPSRRLDWSNLRVLHGWCHSRRTAQDQADARRGFKAGAAHDGAPVDPAHPWNETRQ